MRTFVGRWAAGRKGAGKSTTLKMVVGMPRLTEGQIHVDGHPWSRDDLYGIGSLIERPPLYPNLTARENLLVAPRYSASPGAASTRLYAPSTSPTPVASGRAASR